MVSQLTIWLLVGRILHDMRLTHTLPGLVFRLEHLSRRDETTQYGSCTTFLRCLLLHLLDLLLELLDGVLHLVCLSLLLLLVELLQPLHIVLFAHLSLSPLSLRTGFQEVNTSTTLSCI